MAEKLVNDTGLAEFASKVKEKAVFIKEGQSGAPAILDLIYPVGSIYMSVNNASPQEFLGGTWERIKDTFLLSAGDTYSAGATGGSASINLSHSHTVNNHNHSLPANTGSHTLTVSEIPSHNHGIPTWASGSGGKRVQHATDSAINTGWMYTGNTGGGGGHTHTIGGNTGDKNPGTDSKLSSTQSILPPYLAVYIWKRTA